MWSSYLQSDYRREYRDMHILKNDIKNNYNRENTDETAFFFSLK